MPQNIYRKIIERFYKQINASGTALKVDSDDLVIVLMEFEKLENRVKILEAKAKNILIEIKKVFEMP